MLTFGRSYLNNALSGLKSYRLGRNKAKHTHRTMFLYHYNPDAQSVQFNDRSRSV